MTSVIDFKICLLEVELATYVGKTMYICLSQDPTNHPKNHISHQNFIVINLSIFRNPFCEITLKIRDIFRLII